MKKIRLNAFSIGNKLQYQALFLAGIILLFLIWCTTEYYQLKEIHQSASALYQVEHLAENLKIIEKLEAGDGITKASEINKIAEALKKELLSINQLGEESKSTFNKNLKALGKENDLTIDLTKSSIGLEKFNEQELDTHLKQELSLIGEVVKIGKTESDIAWADYKNKIAFFIGLFSALIFGTYLVQLRKNKKYLTIQLDDIGHTLEEFSKGKLPTPHEIKEQSDFSTIKQKINTAVEMVGAATEFAEHIGNGKLDEEYQNQFSNGQLAHSLITMKEKLKQFNLETELRNWNTEGIAKFAEILRKNNEDLSQLGDEIIRHLVKYLHANQGSFFALNDENPDDLFLEVKATYAWDKKKYVKKRIELGEGLVGQAWQEREQLVIYEVPTDYLHITSGLGLANPDCLLLTPLVFGDTCLGVIEMASFKKWLPHELAFMKQLAESIAATIGGVKVNERTRKLLEDAQAMTTRMSIQEEEMRQNMEEMTATQEEMLRKEAETNELIKQLQKNEEELRIKEELKRKEQELLVTIAEMQKIQEESNEREKKLKYSVQKISEMEMQLANSFALEMENDELKEEIARLKKKT